MNESNATACTFAAESVFPDGRRCPDLMTEAEAIKYLRLDTVGHRHPERTLKHYRDRKLLRPTRVGKKLFYSRWELETFIKKVTEK